jgi:prephenate dehydrogenase
VGDDDPAVWELAAGGFRDTSRVAASDTRMFLDILMTNQDAVLTQLDNYIGQLEELRTLLEHKDEAALAAKLAVSQTTRAQWKPKR